MAVFHYFHHMETVVPSSQRQRARVRSPVAIVGEISVPKTMNSFFFFFLVSIEMKKLLGEILKNVLNT